MRRRRKSPAAEVRLDQWEGLQRLDGTPGNQAAVVEAEPGLKKAIIAFEREHSVALLDRSDDVLRFSVLGEEMLPRMGHVAAEFQRIMSQIRMLADDPKGDVRIGVSHYAPLAADLQQTVATHLPSLSVEIIEASNTDLSRQIAVGDLDLALIVREGFAASVGETPLVRMPLCVIAAPGDASMAEAISFQAFSGRRLFIAALPDPLGFLVQRTARRAALAIDLSVTVDSYAMQRDLVQEGLGWAFTTRAAAREDVRCGALSASAVTDIEREVVLALLRTRVRPATRAIQQVAQVMADSVQHLAAKFSADAVPPMLPL